MPSIVRCWTFLSIEQCFARAKRWHFRFHSIRAVYVARVKTLAGIQKILDDLPYNLSYTARSPKEVLQNRVASCRGRSFAAAALRIIGFRR